MPKKKKSKDNKPIIIKGGYVRTKLSPEELQQMIHAIKSGTGAHKSKKDYTRKKKWTEHD